jgi:hypothetical protein
MKFNNVERDRSDATDIKGFRDKTTDIVPNENELEIVRSPVIEYGTPI